MSYNTLSQSQTIASEGVGHKIMVNYHGFANYRQRGGWSQDHGNLPRKLLPARGVGFCFYPWTIWRIPFRVFERLSLWWGGLSWGVSRE